MILCKVFAPICLTLLWFTCMTNEGSHVCHMHFTCLVNNHVITAVVVFCNQLWKEMFRNVHTCFLHRFCFTLFSSFKRNSYLNSHMVVVLRLIVTSNDVHFTIIEEIWGLIFDTGRIDWTWIDNCLHDKQGCYWISNYIIAIMIVN